MGKEIQHVAIWQAEWRIRARKSIITEKGWYWFAWTEDDIGLSFGHYMYGNEIYLTSDKAIDAWKDWASMNMIANYHIIN